MNELQAREEICRVGRSLFERGYVHATAGNISVRLDDGYLITPTDACLGFLDAARLSKVGSDGEALADEIVEWNERSIADAIRRQARHEDTTRWDVIEFKLD